MDLHTTPSYYFQRLNADRVQFGYQLHLNFSLINIMTAGFIYGIYDGAISSRILLTWTVGLIVVVLLEMGLYAAYLFHRQKLNPWVWESIHLLLNLLGCIGVGGGIWFVQGSSMPQATLPITIITLIYAVVLYGMHLFNARSFALCIAGLLLPMAVFHALQNSAQGVLFMIAFVVVGIMLVTSAMSSSQFFKSSAFNRYRIEELSERLQIEKETTEVALDLAQAANHAKSLFFATANHDFRQPLHAIALLIEALKHEGENSKTTQDILEQMDGNVSTLSKMFNHFLDINRLETGQVQVNLETVELQAIFNDMMLQHRLTAAEKGLQLRMSPTSVKVHTDVHLLARILSNLITNAISYTEHGVVWIGYRASRQTIEIRDSGVGIAAKHHDSVFKDFYQVQQGEQTTPQGYGLGLSIVQRLAHILQLPLTLSSEVGRGSVFRVGIRAVEQMFIPSCKQKSLYDIAPQQRALLSDKCILLIENDDVSRHQMVQVLNDLGLDVKTALSSSGALNLMHLRVDAVNDLAGQATDPEWMPNLIISDYHIGQKIWLELVLSPRQTHHNERFHTRHLEKWYCPIIFTVAENTMIHNKLGVRNSLTVYKPIDVQELINGIVHLLALENQPINVDVSTTQSPLHDF